jgi:hypothetical protein
MFLEYIKFLWIAIKPFFPLPFECFSNNEVIVRDYCSEKNKHIIVWLLKNVFSFRSSKETTISHLEF